MATQRFIRTARFTWQGTLYEVMRLFPEGKVNIEEVFTGAVLLVDLSVLVHALFEGDLAFVGQEQRRSAPRSGRVEAHSQYLPLTDYPDHLVAIACHRLEIIQPYLQMEPGERTREALDAYVLELRRTMQTGEEGKTRTTSLSASSVYRWAKDYREAGNDIRALIPNLQKGGGKGKPRIDQHLNQLIESVIREKYLVREKVTVDVLVSEIAACVEEENATRGDDDKLVPPSRATIARRVQALDMVEAFAARHGKRAARERFSQYEQAEQPRLPLERVEIDHTRTDLLVIDDRDNLPIGRLTLTYCLDVATRYPLGYYMGFEPPSYLTVMECLYHAIRPKEQVKEQYGTEHDWIAYGIPSTLVIDNGREFIGQDLQDACLQLGIILQRTPVRTPHFKGAIERYFGSLNTMLFHTLPGTTFSNSQMRGDYDSADQACIYLSEIDRLMHIFIVDIYAERFHQGLDGIPARRWEQATRSGFFPRVPQSAEELRILLGRVTERAIQRYGIEFETLVYNCPELARLRARLKGKAARVKYHPGDLSRVYVYDPDDELYIEVPALAQDYTHGLSLWKHRIIRRAVLAEQDSVDLAALGRARRKIQQIVEEGKRRKRTGTRSRIARWEQAGAPSRELGHDEDMQQVKLLSNGEVSAASLDHTPTPDTHQAVEIEALLTEARQDKEGWEVTYTLPKSRRDAPTENAHAEKAYDSGE